jgi:hypothetical protein
MNRLVLLSALVLAACAHQKNPVPQAPETARKISRTEWLATSFRNEVARYAPKGLTLYIHPYSPEYFPPTDQIDARLREYGIPGDNVVVADFNFSSEAEMRNTSKNMLDYARGLKKRFELFSTVHGASQWARLMIVFSHLDSIESHVLFEESFGPLK